MSCILLVGCGGRGGSTDVDPTLVFADRSDAEISRLVAAASAGDGFAAESQLFQFDDPSSTDPCPTVDEDIGANTVTITGGCTTIDGTTIDGSATVTNPIGWGDLGYDFTSSSRYQFDGFSLTTQSIAQAWDGVFTISSSFAKLDLDLTTDLLGIAVRSDLYMECSKTGCEHGNSGIELVGVGGALVSGSIGVGGQTTNGSMTLEGADTVKVTIANNCTSWQLVGTDRTFNPCAGL